ncbi:MAG TPA: carboxypeptidase-like regulatory domain-containing protein, partial [Myxococcaceae bacterium]|nr:carboxypeptidase-like regulatory domain-containing protein [Myxococcaceae bacterium]
MSKRQKDVWRSARAALVGIGLLCGSTAFAQLSGSTLTGNVVDASTKAPVADVVVTATSPGLQGEQVVVTDASGLYRVPQLPPGIYTLRFEKESFRPFSRTGIEVQSDRTLRLNVELLPETAGATEISVVGSPPTVDVGSSTTGTT